MNNITEHPKQLLDERMHCSSKIPSQNGVFNKQTECISNLNRTVKQPMNTLGTMQNALDKVTPCVNTMQTANPILQTGNVISGLHLVPTKIRYAFCLLIKYTVLRGNCTATMHSFI
jgi:hypothetical protein